MSTPPSQRGEGKAPRDTDSATPTHKGVRQTSTVERSTEVSWSEANHAQKCRARQTPAAKVAGPSPGAGRRRAGANSAASLRGDGLALLGGVLAAAYLLFGRAVRPRVGFLTYGAQVCLVCALTLLPLALAVDAPLGGYSTAAWGALAAMALGPQLLGHVLLNFSVKYVSASVVAAVRQNAMATG